MCFFLWQTDSSFVVYIWPDQTFLSWHFSFKMGDLRKVIVLLAAFLTISCVKGQQWPVGVSPAYPGNGSYGINVQEVLTHLINFQVPSLGFLRVLARLWHQVWCLLRKCWKKAEFMFLFYFRIRRQHRDWQLWEPLSWVCWSVLQQLRRKSLYRRLWRSRLRC